MIKVPRDRPARERRSQSVSADDSALFRDSIQGVRPLQSDTVPLRRKPLPLRAARQPGPGAHSFPVLLDPSESELTSADTLDFKRVGVQHAVMRKLRRGEFSIDRALDLHGATGAQAKARLLGFLRVCQADGARCIRIIHGKGYRSPGQQPVLKPRIAHWLNQHPAVVAYCSARADDGGTGALYVLLKRDA